jgi:hypothetical protein
MNKIKYVKIKLKIVQYIVDYIYISVQNHRLKSTSNRREICI